jgi:hypothetical protein
MRRSILPAALAAALLFCAGQALAAPGPADSVDGPEVAKGELTLHLGFAQLLTRHDDEGQIVNTEVGYDLSDRLHLGASADIDVTHSPFVAATTVEALYNVGHVGGVETAFTFGYTHAWRGEDGDSLQARALFSKTAGRFEGRLNLVAQQNFSGEHDADFGYAALAVVRANDNLQLGVKALGGLASTHGFGGQSHYVGPSAVVTLPLPRAAGEIRIEAAYLAAYGPARDDARGLWSVVAQWERVF